MTDFIATAETEISAGRAQVWAALTDPELIREYLFGSEVVTDWQVGSPIVWKGVFDGKPYEDKGRILEFQPNRRLVVTHFSPLSGAEDVPESYHTLTYELQDDGGHTRISLSQDNNPTEEAAAHSRSMWTTMLDGLKAVVEAG